MPVTTRCEDSWTDRNIDAIVDCFDQAFANVLNSEFKRITKGMNQDEIDNWLEESEASIDLLKISGNSPDYQDPMVCLRYVIMYQLPHINLAYSLVKGTQRGDYLVSTTELQVVDFGAGCLAMAFGLILAVADALESGERIDEVRIDCIDESKPMMKLGRKLLKYCNKFARRSDDMKPFVEAYRRAKFRHYNDCRHIRRTKDSERWLAALHTLYDDSETDVDRAMSGLNSELKPSQIFISCHDSKSAIAERIWPNCCDWSRGNELGLRFQGRLNSSSTAQVAFEKRFQPQTWHQPNLYTAFKDLATFTTRELRIDDDELNDLPWC